MKIKSRFKMHYFKYETLFYHHFDNIQAVSKSFDLTLNDNDRLSKYKCHIFKTSSNTIQLFWFNGG